MRILYSLLSLGLALGPLPVKLSGQEPTLQGVREIQSPDTLATAGLYPVLVYKGRPLAPNEIVKSKERWEGILPVEEVKFLPSWERYRFQLQARLLLVVDADNTLYLAKTEGFEPVGYIKKKGVMKRTMAIVWKGLKFGLDGPLHIILSIYGL